MKKFTVRAARKTAHLSNKVLSKSLRFTTRVENKATRIIDGTDYSLGVEKTVPIEKIYYNTLKYITPLNPALPKVGQDAAIVLLLPSLNNRAFYGGTATALVVAGLIAEKTKRPLRIVETLETGHATKLSTFFKKEGINLTDESINIVSVADRAYNVYGYLPMHTDDIFIASAWWDAHLISKLPLTKKFVYLIQDYEPVFYNNSDLFVLAEQTYMQNRFVPLCNTKLMYDFMQNKGYKGFRSSSVYWFEPAVSRIASGLVIKKKPGDKKRLLLYGRPDVHRNLFFTGLESIDRAFQNNYLSVSDWEVFMAGQDKIPSIKLACGMHIENLGKMSMDDYIAFSKSIDVAVSLMMAPHPNYPTLEFASIGSAVVTTKYDIKTNLSNYSKNIITSDIGVDELSLAIKEASHKDYDTRVTAAKNANILTSWHESLNKVTDKVLESL